MDTLEISIYGHWSPEHLEPLCRQLETAKLARQASNSAGAGKINFPEGDEAIVLPNGFKRGCHHKYVFDWQGWQVGIVERANLDQNYPSISVKVGSVPLMRFGHVKLWQDLCSLLSSLGFVLSHTVVARLDVCVDLVGYSVVDEAWKAHEEQRIICKSRRFNPIGNASFKPGVPDDYETYYRGNRKTLIVRFYDKLKECKNDPLKYTILETNRWGCRPDKAMRVEFEVRNATLSKLGFLPDKSVNSVFARIGDIATWLHSKWFRIVEHFDRSNRNHAHAVVSPFWREVQESFDSWAVNDDSIPLAAPVEAGPRDFLLMLKQSDGYLMNIAATCGASRQEVLQALLELRSDEEWEQAVAARRAKQAAMGLTVDDPSAKLFQVLRGAA